LRLSGVVAFTGNPVSGANEGYLAATRANASRTLDRHDHMKPGFMVKTQNLTKQDRVTITMVPPLIPRIPVRQNLPGSARAAESTSDPGQIDEGVYSLPKFLPTSMLLGIMTLCIAGSVGIYACLLREWDEQIERRKTLVSEGLPDFKGLDIPDPTRSRSSTAESDAGDWMKAFLSRDPGAHSHEIKWEQYFVLGFWILLLITQAAFTRLICKAGIPRDCEPNTDTVNFVAGNHMLILHGYIVATFTGLYHPNRFWYIFSCEFEESGIGRYIPRAAVFLVVFFLSSPFWGSLDLVPFLSFFSLTTGGAHSNFPVMQILLISLVIGLAIFLVGWHLFYAWTYNSVRGFLAYLISRLVVFFIFAAYFWAAAHEAAYTYHLHHYALGFLFAILGEFNHKLSLIVLAAGSGIMVQGIASYGADPITIHDM